MQGFRKDVTESLRLLLDPKQGGNLLEDIHDDEVTIYDVVMHAFQECDQLHRDAEDVDGLVCVFFDRRTVERRGGCTLPRKEGGKKGRKIRKEKGRQMKHRK